jgi:hypothetical protein
MSSDIFKFSKVASKDGKVTVAGAGGAAAELEDPRPPNTVGVGAAADPVAGVGAALLKENAVVGAGVEATPGADAGV